ncbi:MAG: TonB-dependent receptor [Methylococcaceae bacterium]|jgi:iron complex outermembrane receptor protein
MKIINLRFLFVSTVAGSCLVLASGHPVLAETVTTATSTPRHPGPLDTPTLERVDSPSANEKITAAGKAGREPEVIELDEVHVVSDSPLASPATGVSVYKTPSPIQSVTSDELEETQAWSLPDYMRRYLGSVSVNDAQNNPMQPDVQFRGFTASSLLGLPQGLSVYVNGVRFNEIFGDTVNWNLISEGAIERMDLHSGSNAVYGLNSLGGAISMKTKTGFSAPGHSLEVYGGSWGRNVEEIMSGWNDGTFGYYIDLRNFQENGWRQFSPTDVKQALGTFSWRGERSDLDLTLAGNGSSMNGNGSTPVQLYEQDRSAIFTHPDQTKTEMFLASLQGSSFITDKIELSGTAYFRQNLVPTFNGDDTDVEACSNPAYAGYLCEEEGDEEELVLDVNGNPVKASSSNDSATQNTSQTNMRTAGAMVQGAFEQDLFSYKNRFVGGGSYDEGNTSFQSDAELGELTSTRGTTGSGIYTEDGRVRLNTNTTYYGVFFTDTLSLTEKLALTVAGRYNQARITLIDKYGTDLNGDHQFSRFNPSGGLTYSFMPELQTYASYNESNRAPTAVELSCANPLRPCKLPNAFLSDPPLNQVVAKTAEAGFRGQFRKLYGGNIDWSAGYFNTVNTDDILFINSGTLANQGYFSNVGDTLRQGLELSVSADYEPVRFGFNYTYLDATFQTPFTANSPNNPYANAEGATYVRPGDYIPGLPQNIAKAYADWLMFDGFTFGSNLNYQSYQYMRGDEANQNKPIGGYVVVNLTAEYRYNENVAIFGRFDNIFNRNFQTFGNFGQAAEVLGPQYNNPRFVGPGAPQAGWVGVKLTL